MGTGGHRGPPLRYFHGSVWFRRDRLGFVACGVTAYYMTEIAGVGAGLPDPPAFPRTMTSVGRDNPARRTT